MQTRKEEEGEGGNDLHTLRETKSDKKKHK